MKNLDETYYEKQWGKDYENYFRKEVEAGGGVWVGIQECEGWPYDLVLFNSPKTGSTLALSTAKISGQAVLDHIHASNRQWEEINARD